VFLAFFDENAFSIVLGFDLDDAPLFEDLFGADDSFPDQNALCVNVVVGLPLNALQHEFLVFFDGCRTSFHDNYVRQARCRHSICYQADTSQVELLRVHVNFKT
jgi:hypothetical protein